MAGEEREEPPRNFIAKGLAEAFTDSVRSFKKKQDLQHQKVFMNVPGVLSTYKQMDDEKRNKTNQVSHHKHISGKNIAFFRVASGRCYRYARAGLLSQERTALRCYCPETLQWDMM